jgi:hypothetical protein
MTLLLVRIEHVNRMALKNITKVVEDAKLSATDAHVDFLMNRLELRELDHAKERARHEAAAHAQVTALLSQLQVMAERLAALKLGTAPDANGVVAVEERATPFFVPDPADKPYSPGLFAFMRALDSDDTRHIVEEYVEARRSAGADDEQILDQLNRGEYVDV